MIFTCWSPVFSKINIKIDRSNNWRCSKIWYQLAWKTFVMENKNPQHFFFKNTSVGYFCIEYILIREVIIFFCLILLPFCCLKILVRWHLVDSPSIYLFVLVFLNDWSNKPETLRLFPKFFLKIFYEVWGGYLDPF